MKKKYTEQDIQKVMGQDMELPESVNSKIDETLQKIREQNRVTPYTKKQKTWKRSVAAAAIGILALSGITVTAATLSGWNKDVAKRFQADEKQQKELSEKKVTVPVEAQAENGGYTIKLEQALCAEQYMYLYFTITAPEGQTISNDIGFEEVTLLVDGKDIADDEYMGGYCSGVPDEELLKEEQAGNVLHYEFWVQLDSTGESLSGKTMTANFKNMYFGTTQNETDIVQGPTGTWDVSWQMDYESSEQDFEVNQKLNEDDITVKKIVLSPISISIDYDWKRIKKTVPVIYQDGTEGTVEKYEEPTVWAKALKLKDGTVEEPDTSGMEEIGFVSQDDRDNTYRIRYGCGKVIDVDNVVAVIFHSDESGQDYEVPMK